MHNNVNIPLACQVPKFERYGPMKKFLNLNLNLPIKQGERRENSDLEFDFGYVRLKTPPSLRIGTCHGEAETSLYTGKATVSYLITFPTYM